MPYALCPVVPHLSEKILAYYVEWQMLSLLALMLFDEDDWHSAIQLQKFVVKAAKSDPARAKIRIKRTADNLPVHSFQILLVGLGTITHNKTPATMEGASWVFDKITQSTSVQQKALDLLGVSLICTH
jgi:hypothetical protein